MTLIKAMGHALWIGTASLLVLLHPAPHITAIQSINKQNSQHLVASAITAVQTAQTVTSKKTQTKKQLSIVKSIVQPISARGNIAAVPQLPLDPVTLNDQTRAAVVNIFCVTKVGGDLYPISGSGVIVDGRGVVLTNAHVAQYFLLRDYRVPNNVDCTIRTGSPAQTSYTATLLYLPPKWVSQNASQITSQEPMGTGENDYAFLLITGSADGNAVPSSYPHLSMSMSLPDVGSPVFLAAYPAGFIEGTTIRMNLYASSAYATIQKLFTFKSNSVDLVSLGGSIVAQAGSSGGAVVRTDTGSLVGIITTDTNAPTTAARDLHAITLSHINDSLQADGLGGISPFLVGNVQDLANTFEQTLAPQLRQELMDKLSSR